MYNENFSTCFETLNEIVTTFKTELLIYFLTNTILSHQSTENKCLSYLLTTFQSRFHNLQAHKCWYSIFTVDMDGSWTLPNANCMIHPFLSFRFLRIWPVILLNFTRLVSMELIGWILLEVFKRPKVVAWQIV